MENSICLFKSSPFGFLYKHKKAKPFGLGLKRRLPTLPRENRSTIGASELNLPRIASQSILGFGRWRFGRVYKHPLLSPAAPVLCFTEQLSSLVSNSIAIFQWKIASASLSEDHLRSLYFYICTGIILCRNEERRLG